jgi:hypothetical protein
VLLENVLPRNMLLRNMVLRNLVLRNMVLGNMVLGNILLRNMEYKQLGLSSFLSRHSRMLTKEESTRCYPSPMAYGWGNI